MFSSPPTELPPPPFRLLVMIKVGVSSSSNNCSSSSTCTTTHDSNNQSGYVKCICTYILIPLFPPDTRPFNVIIQTLVANDSFSVATLSADLRTCNVEFYSNSGDMTSQAEWSVSCYTSRRNLAQWRSSSVDVTLRNYKMCNVHCKRYYVVDNDLQCHLIIL